MLINPEQWKEVLVYVGALMAGAVLFSIKKIRFFIVNRFTTKHSLDARYCKTDRNIKELITELRVSTGAIRCCLFQFHNGQNFLSSQPIWRASCTHESCAAGVSHELINRQSILASSLTSILGLLFDLDDPAITANWEGLVQYTHDNVTYYVMQTVHMPVDSYGRQMFLMGGVYQACIIPVTYQKQLIGFLSLGFRNGQKIDEEKLKESINYVAAVIYEMKMRS